MFITLSLRDLRLALSKYFNKNILIVKQVDFILAM